MRRLYIFTTMIFLSPAVIAHGFGGSGYLHPLTGIDHLIAIVAVGAWSAQLGGKAIWLVPASFLMLMCVGGLAGVSQLSIGFTEYGIALSVILLGLAIAIDQHIYWFPAVAAVGIFGFCHGYSHGMEIPKQAHTAVYITGFMITTLGLHVAGATGGLLLIEEKQGRNKLRVLGAVAAVTGLVLLILL